MKISYKIHRATTISTKTGKNRKIFSKKKTKFKGLQNISFVTKAEIWHDLMKREVACAVSETHVSATAT